MPRKTDNSGGKSSSADEYYSKRQKEAQEASKRSTSYGNQGAYDDLYNVDPGENDLLNAQFKSIMSGVPIIGPLLKGVEGAQQLQDLYDNTGKVPAYPAMDGRAGGLGYTASNLAFSAGNRIFSGAHDLYQFYSGEADAFRTMTNNSYL